MGVKQQRSKDISNSLEQLDKAIIYFLEKQDLYDELDKASVSKSSSKEASNKEVLIPGIVSIVAGFMASILFVMCIGYGILSIPFIIIDVVAIATLFVIGIILIAWYSRLKTYGKVQPKQIWSVNKELFQYYNEYTDCPVNHIFTNPKVLLQLRNIIKSGRAVDIDSAIDILLRDNHLDKEELYIKYNEDSIISFLSNNLT